MTLASVSGFFAIAMGAFAAHAAGSPRTAELVRTGATYQFMHSMTTFACATFMNIGGARARHAPAFFLGGIVLFSGSLYALAAGAPAWVGAITPLGGIGFLVGWVVLAWAARTIDQS